MKLVIKSEICKVAKGNASINSVLLGRAHDEINSMIKIEGCMADLPTVWCPITKRKLYPDYGDKVVECSDGSRHIVNG